MNTATLTANPTLPNGEQEIQVLVRLRKGPLTPLQALSELGVYRLAAVVHRLRRRGWDIASEELEVTCKGARQARVAQYSLTLHDEAAPC